VPANISVECDAVPAPANVTATDNCSFNGVVNYSETRANGNCPSNYTLTRTWSATDAAGNTKTASQVITVSDNTAPVLSAVPADIAVECDQVPTPATLTATDNCSAPTIAFVETRTNGNCISNYTLTRTWTATDACGNSSSKTQTITVSDTTPPVLSAAPANAVAECDAVPAPAVLTATDNCNTATVSFHETRTNGNCISNYTLTRTWTAVDECGNSSSRTQVITVQDTQPPVLSAAPASVTVECDAVPAPAVLTAVDNCSTATVVFTELRTNGSCPSSYILTRVWVAFDLCGNATSKTQVIVVRDTQAPVLSAAPADVTVECDNVPEPAILTATDNCDQPTVTYAEVRTNGNCVSNYTLTRTWTATDACGNSSSKTQVITVHDTTPPVLTTSSDISVTNDATKCGAVVNYSSSATDNCNAATITYSHQPGSFFAVGATLVTVTATDACGNSTVKTFTVTVTDNENPVITCAANQTQTADAGDCGGNVTVVPPVTSDNCGIASVVNSYNNTANASAHYPVGTTSITWTVTDLHGNSVNCTQTITVTDNEDPVVTCAPNQVQTADAGDCGANVVVVGPATSDNCGVATVVNSYNNTANASAHYPVGVTSITWTITDIHGNNSNCIQTITVTDNENPVITCAANQAQTADAGDCGANVVVVSPVTSDNCGVASVVNSFNNTANASGHYPVGTTTVLWVVTDIHGNTSNCTQTITVTDNEHPVLHAGADQFFCFNGSQYTIPALQSADNCGVATITYAVTGATTRTGNGSDASGLFNPGTSTVTWTVTDIHGNVSTDAMVVVVNPELLIMVPPVSVLPQGVQPNTVYIGYAPASALTITANVSGGTAPYIYQWTSSGAGLSITTPNAAAPQTITLQSTVAGIYTITLQITDSKGCIKIITETITSVDLRCGVNNDKVIMCRTDVVNPGPATPQNPHRPPTAGQPPVKDACVAQNTVATLLANGASLGDCPVAPVTVKTGVKKPAAVETEISLLAYPNPNTGQFRLRLTGMNKGNATIQFIDGNGKMTSQRNVVITSSEEEFAFNLRSLAAGMYTVRVVSGETVKTTRIVIAR
jgi:large repetitive protein